MRTNELRFMSQRVTSYYPMSCELRANKLGAGSLSHRDPTSWKSTALLIHPNTMF